MTSRRTFFCLSTIILFFAATGQVPYEQWLREEEQKIEQVVTEDQADFKNFVENDERAFAEYKAKVEKKWREFINSTPEEWVSYSSDLDGMSRVDFKAGKVVIEALVETHSEGDMNEARAKVASEVDRLLSDDNIIGSNLLRGQLLYNKEKIVTAENQEKFIREIVENTKKTIGHFKGKDNVDRMRVRLEIPMAPDHVRTRAESYYPHAQKYADLYKVDLPLLMAIMETESTFNPMAKSPIPAYGLMQIVPRYAGRAVNQKFFETDDSPLPSQLYRPEDNIQFGAAYINLMRNQEFRRVADDRSALYLLVAAYNTGPSNVARAVTGKTGINNAVDAVNSMTPDSLFVQLVDNLPSQETRDYLHRVIGRVPHYVEWDQEQQN